MRLRRPPIRRVVVTTPPAQWFYGIAADLAGVYRAALVELGIEVFEVPVDAFFPPDPDRIERIAREVRAFAPELALGLTHGSYALICRLPPRPDGRRLNLFTDVLDLPTICLWDHAPLELAHQVLDPPPHDPTQSRPGALAELCRTLEHPRLIHWSRDSGQSRIMVELGLAAVDRIIETATPALPPYRGRAVQPTADGVGFVGHLYQTPAPSRGAFLGELVQDAAAAWAAGSSPGLWHELTCRIDALPRDTRAWFRLSRDETFFWGFAHRFVLHEAQTAARLAALGAAGVTVWCTGNLDVGAPGVPANLVAASDRVSFREGLRDALTRHPVTLDILNPGFIDGYSTKPVQTFASGGFALVNRTSGFVESFGDAGAAATWTDHDDLAAKVELYLSRPKLRDEIGDSIRASVKAKHRVTHVLRGVLEQAWALR